MKYVTGYLTNDGEFFEDIGEAKRKEAEDTLRKLCLASRVNAARLIDVIEAMADPIKDYIDAYKATTAQAIKDTPRVDRDPADDERGSADSPPVEQFEIGGHEPVSDLGNSS